MTADDDSHRFFARLELLVGRQGLARLAASRVTVVGLGAVGSFAAEALARSGVGALTLVDFDLVGATNINRQLFALSDNLGVPKVKAAAERLRRINPRLEITALQKFYHHDTAAEILAGAGDFLIDAIDGVGPKIDLICRCRQLGIPFISAMGAAGRRQPGAVGFAELEETSGCPLCRVMRKALRRRGIRSGVPVVYSREPAAVKPRPPAEVDEELREEHQPRGRRRHIQPSAIFMPGIFGLLAAQYAVDRLLAGREEKE
ncbi:MAG: tRNA threonylcarbamoyladenosine dehydratase [Deltaproteobacteria bacterium]|nr:tRNA threonylcarbamoyladenosine dehydratase [Deltaproteobacteria bacterium]